MRKRPKWISMRELLDRRFINTARPQPGQELLSKACFLTRRTTVIVYSRITVIVYSHSTVGLSRSSPIIELEYKKGEESLKSVYLLHKLYSIRDFMDTSSTLSLEQALSKYPGMWMRRLFFYNSAQGEIV
jgi:hypothetical protein